MIRQQTILLLLCLCLHSQVKTNKAAARRHSQTDSLFQKCEMRDKRSLHNLMRQYPVMQARVFTTKAGVLPGFIGKSTKPVSFGVTQNDTMLLAYVEMVAARALFEKGDYDRAIRMAEKALEQSIRKHEPTIARDAGEVLRDSYRKKGQFREALHYQVIYTQYHEQILADAQQASLQKYRMKVAVERKNKAILQQQKQLVEQEKNKEVQQLLTGSITLSFVMALFIGMIMYKRMKQSIQLQNNQIVLEVKEKKIAHLQLKARQLENEELKKELEFKQKELLSFSLNLLHKKQLMTELKEQVEQLPADKEIRKVKNTIEAGLNSDNEWEEFRQRFEQVHTGFIEQLKQQYPQLSANDMKICAFLKLNFSSKQIAILLNIAPGSVDISRYRLKKKLNLDANDTLLDFVMRF